MTMSQVVDTLAEARAAAERQSWRSAYGTYSEVADAELTPSDLENYGEAAWWSGKLDEAIALRERAYTGYTAAGDELGAARIALTLSWDNEARGSLRSPVAGSRTPSVCSRTFRRRPSTAGCASSTP